MNLLKAIYCNQYYELKPKGKAHAARTNGTGLVTVGLVLLVFALTTLLIIAFPDLGEYLENLLKEWFGVRSGRTIGRAAALIPFLIIYPLVKNTLGTTASYQATITQFESYSETRKKEISRLGMSFFFFCLISVAIPLLYFLL